MIGVRAVLKRSINPSVTGVVGSLLGVGLAVTVISLQGWKWEAAASAGEIVFKGARNLIFILPALLALIGSLRRAPLPLLIATISTVPSALVVYPGLGILLLVSTPLYAWAFAGLASVRVPWFSGKEMLVGLVSIVCLGLAVFTLLRPSQFVCRDEPQRIETISEHKVSRRFDVNASTECFFVPSLRQSVVGLIAIAAGFSIGIVGSSSVTHPRVTQ